MSGKKYKVARAYSLRMLKDDTPGIYRKISDDIPSTRNPRTNRPLSFAYGENDISVLRRYNGERDDIPVERNRNALTWSGESPFRTDVSLSELSPQRSASTEINGDSELLPYDLDKKGALILRDIDIKEQSDKNRYNDSRRSSSSNSENDIRDKSTEKRNSRSRSSSSSSSEKAGKSKRRKSSSSASSVEGDNLIQGHQNEVETTVLSEDVQELKSGPPKSVLDNDLSNSVELINDNNTSLERKSSSSTPLNDPTETKGDVIEGEGLLNKEVIVVQETSIDTPSLNSTDKRRTVYEEPWDYIEHYGADETRNVNVNNSDHNSSLSSIENQIIDDVQTSIPQGMEDKNPESVQMQRQRSTDSSSSSGSNTSSTSGEKYITSSHSSEAPPLPMSKPPEIMKDKEIEREMDEQSLQSEPYVDIESQENKTKELENGQTETGNKRLSVTYYGPVYMHDNVLIMPTSPSQFSGGDTSYESGMIFQGQIELEHVPDDHVDIESNDSSNEDTSNAPEISNIKISLSNKAKSIDNSDENENESGESFVEPVPIISAEFVQPTEISPQITSSNNTEVKSDSGSTSSSSSDSDSSKNKKSRPVKCHVKQASVSSDSDEQQEPELSITREDETVLPAVEEPKVETLNVILSETVPPVVNQYSIDTTPSDDNVIMDHGAAVMEPDIHISGDIGKQPDLNIPSATVDTVVIADPVIVSTINQEPDIHVTIDSSDDLTEKPGLTESAAISEPEIPYLTSDEPDINIADNSLKCDLVCSAEVEKPEIDITNKRTEIPVCNPLTIDQPVLYLTTESAEMPKLDAVSSEKENKPEIDITTKYITGPDMDLPTEIINKPEIKKSTSSSSSSSSSSSDSSDTEEVSSANSEKTRNKVNNLSNTPTLDTSYETADEQTFQVGSNICTPPIIGEQLTNENEKPEDTFSCEDQDIQEKFKTVDIPEIEITNDSLRKALPDDPSVDILLNSDKSIRNESASVMLEAPEVNVVTDSPELLSPQVSYPIVPNTDVNISGKLDNPEYSTENNPQFEVEIPVNQVKQDISITSDIRQDIPDIKSRIQEDISVEYKPEINLDFDSKKCVSPSVCANIDVPDPKLEIPQKNAPLLSCSQNHTPSNDTMSAELPTNYVPYIPEMPKETLPKIESPLITIEQSKDGTPEIVTPSITIKRSEDGTPEIGTPSITIEQSKDGAPEMDTPSMSKVEAEYPNKKAHKIKDPSKRKPDFGLKIPEKITSLVHKLSFKSGSDKNHSKSTDNIAVPEPLVCETAVTGSQSIPATKNKKRDKPEIKEVSKKGGKKANKLRKLKKKRSRSTSSSSSSSSSDEVDDIHQQDKAAMKQDKDVSDKEIQVNVFKIALKTDQLPQKYDDKQNKKKKKEKSPPNTPESPFEKLSHIFHRTHKTNITETKQEDKRKKDKTKKDKSKPASSSTSDNRDRNSQASNMSEEQIVKTDHDSPLNVEDKHNDTNQDESPLKTLTEYSKLLEQTPHTPEEKSVSKVDNQFKNAICQSDSDDWVQETTYKISDDEKIIQKSTNQVSFPENEVVIEEKILKVEAIKKCSSTSESSSDEPSEQVVKKNRNRVSFPGNEITVEEKIQKVEAIKKSSSTSESSDDDSSKRKHDKNKERKKSTSSLDDNGAKSISVSNKSKDNDNDSSAKPPLEIEVKYNEPMSAELETKEQQDIKNWKSPDKLKRTDSTSSSSSSSSSSSKSSQKIHKSKHLDSDIREALETTVKGQDHIEEPMMKTEMQATNTAISNTEFDSADQQDIQPDIIHRRELSVDTTACAEVEQALQTLDNSIFAAEQPPRHQGHFVVVAIDFGTAYSGYAFSFTRDPDSIHMMRKWEGGDPGIINQKTPTIMLLTPDGSFHSFGYNARDNYHDLDKERAQEWMYFDKFKMTLHTATNLTTDTMLTAANGRHFSALKIFTFALSYFRDHVIRELSDQSGIKILNEDIRWVVCVPAIWKAPAKQFMRQAAYKAGIASEEFPDQLLIALEPEVASIYCRKLRMHQLVPEVPRPLQSPTKNEPVNLDNAFEISNQVNEYSMEMILRGTRYIVVDCGGGTVDITVHELDSSGKLAELHKATGGPYGSIGVDVEFEKLMISIFGRTFIEQYKLKRSAGWVDMLIAFESRKRSATPYKTSPLNIALPFSFIDYYRKHKMTGIDTVIRRHGNREITWSSQGMLRLSPDAMRKLFLPTIQKIKEKIGSILNNNIADLKYLFLVGGFAESAIVQNEIRQEFGNIIQVIIPQGVAMTILKGAVLFGLDPTIVNVRRCPLTYGVGVLNRFNPHKHPLEKKVSRQGIDWCTDIFDKYVVMDQPVTIGDVILRSYTPARIDQRLIQINIYCCENTEPKFITDSGVHKVGTVTLHLSGTGDDTMPKRREIQTRMQFGETEIRVSALDVSTGEHIQSSVDFLSR